MTEQDDRRQESGVRINAHGNARPRAKGSGALFITRLFLAMLLFLFATLPGSAQKTWETPRGGEFPFSFGPIGLGTLVKEAGVTEAQLRQIGEIYQSNRHQLIDLRADVEKKEGDLQVMLDTPQVNAAEAERTVDALLEARNRLAKVTTMMMVRMRQMVTQEQWRKIAELQRRVPPPPPPPAPPAPPAAGAPPRPARAPHPVPAPPPPPAPPEE